MKKVTIIYKAKPYVEVIYECEIIEALYEGEAFGLVSYKYNNAKTGMYFPQRNVVVVNLDSVESITIENENNGEKIPSC